MAVVSITRLRLRSPLFLPAFLWRAEASRRQAIRAHGCLGADVRSERFKVFWTRTLWRDRDALVAYIATGPHRAAMPKLASWCDEAAVARWEVEGEALPDWAEVERRMREDGRLSRVLHPSPEHAAGRTA
jgi:hypothetical protein